MATLRCIHVHKIQNGLLRCYTGTRMRLYATELPRPPPPTGQPVVEDFSGPSQPHKYYARPNSVPESRRQLPLPRRRWPLVFAVVAVGLTSWAAFLSYATNQEKLSSSVFRSIMRAVRGDSQVREVLGEAIRPQPEWWLNGDPYITGQIGQLQGNIDVSFRIRGSKGSGTVYFTSIRREKGRPFTTLRFKVICDDGRVLHVEG
ncbi:hypothetical protein AX17_004681 [Amanita inopinata Kibby_2008]|nr:hypothetical protein AX17_004681 [Amanita inopinata Kibby_2008]